MRVEGVEDLFRPSVFRPVVLLSTLGHEEDTGGVTLGGEVPVREV